MPDNPSTPPENMWEPLPVGSWFFLDSPECTHRYSVQERTHGGCSIVCSTPYIHTLAKRQLQEIAAAHNDSIAPAPTPQVPSRELLMPNESDAAGQSKIRREIVDHICGQERPMLNEFTGTEFGQCLCGDTPPVPSAEQWLIQAGKDKPEFADAEPWERHMRAVDIVRGLLLDCCTCPRTALDAQGEPNKSTCELTEEEHAVFVPGRTVVHYIRRWSGNREDETPLCGADSFHRTESGIMHDSAGNSMNICKECAEIALRSSIADESVEIARRELLKDFSDRMSMEETATCAYRIAAAIRAGR